MDVRVDAIQLSMNIPEGMSDATDTAGDCAR